MKGRKVIIVDDDFNEFSQVKTAFEALEIDSVLKDDDIKKFQPGDGFKQASDFIKQTIKNNYKDLALLSLDLKYNGHDKAGIEFCKNLRQNGIEGVDKWLTENLPVVIVSRYTEDYTPELQRLPHSKFLSKKDINDCDKFRPIVESLLNEFLTAYQSHQREITQKKYKIGLSFTGMDSPQAPGYKCEPHREFVREIAHRLYWIFTKDKVFYDEDKNLIGFTPDTLKDLYQNDCEYIIVFFSSDYGTERNEWTRAEWNGIKTYFAAPANELNAFEENEKQSVKLVNEKKNVIFCYLDSEWEDKLSEFNLQKLIGVRADGSIQDFYKARRGTDIDNVTQKKNELLKYQTTIFEYNETLVTEYEGKRDSIIKTIVGKISEHIG